LRFSCAASKNIFSDGTTENAPSGYFEKRFTKPGQYLTVTVLEKPVLTTSTTVENLQFFSSFKDDSYQFLTAGNSKMVLGTKRNRTFRCWSVSLTLTLEQEYFPDFYGAVVNESFYLFIQ
jgi:hypothetical protein